MRRAAPRPLLRAAKTLKASGSTSTAEHHLQAPVDHHFFVGQVHAVSQYLDPARHRFSQSGRVGRIDFLCRTHGIDAGRGSRSTTAPRESRLAPDAPIRANAWHRVGSPHQTPPPMSHRSPTWTLLDFHIRRSARVIEAKIDAAALLPVGHQRFSSLKPLSSVMMPARSASSIKPLARPVFTQNRRP